MMLKNKHFIYILLLSLIVTSCGVTNKKAMRTTTFMPDRVELRLSLDDFELLGEAEVSVTYNRYLGLITVLHEINDKEVAKRNINQIDTYGRTWLPIGPKLKRALYDAQIEIPKADIFVPVSIITEEQKMFGGSKVKKIMKVKAFRIKDY